MKAISFNRMTSLNNKPERRRQENTNIGAIGPIWENGFHNHHCKGRDFT